MTQVTLNVPKWIMFVWNTIRVVVLLFQLVIIVAILPTTMLLIGGTVCTLARYDGLNEENATNWVVRPFCSNCGIQIEDTTKKCCPNCGVLFEKKPIEKRVTRKVYDCQWWQLLFIEPKIEFKEQDSD